MRSVKLYKRASRFLQTTARSGAENSKARRPKAYEPRTKTQQRKWWWPVIKHHQRIGTNVRSAYGKRFPQWLELELHRLSPECWLAQHDRKTGKRRKASEAVGATPTIASTYLEKLAKRSSAKVRKSKASTQRHEDPAIIQKRHKRRMEGVKVFIRKGKTLHPVVNDYQGRAQ